jgi:hypothetical protein
MIENSTLNNGLNNQDFKTFWLFRVKREPSPKARERYESIVHDSDRTYVVWKDAAGINYKELIPIQQI